MENVEKQVKKKYKARDKKTSKPKMKVTGKSVFQLQRLVRKSPTKRITKSK
jgi:hypothetical protein